MNQSSKTINNGRKKKKYKASKTLHHFRVREKLINESNFKCQKCKSKMELNEIQMHHKDSNPQNENLDNLEILCIKCHGKIHGRKYQNYQLVKRNRSGRPVINTWTQSYEKTDTGKRKGLFL